MEHNNRFLTLSFLSRVLLPTTLSIALFICVFFLLFIPQIENAIMERKREMIRELTHSAWSILETSYRSEQDGLMTRERAQADAKAQIRQLRYGDGRKDYFWITDYTPRMIMHPYRPELDGKDLSRFDDSHGKKLFVEMSGIAQKHNEGYVSYMWQWKDDTAHIVPKLSFVKAFAPWKWVIGTGIYIEDVKKEIFAFEEKIINVSVVITILLSVLMCIIIYQHISTEKRRSHAERELNASREKYRALVEASTEGLILILKDAQVFYNKTLYTILGYPDDSATLNLAELILEPQKFAFLHPGTAGMEEAAPDVSKQIETTFRTADGGSVNVLVMVSRISFSQDSGIVLSVKDISSHKIIEAELLSQKEQFLALMNQLSIGIFRVSTKKDLHFMEANQNTLDILRIESREVLPKTSFRECFADPDEFESMYADLQKNRSIQNRTLRIANGAESRAATVSAVMTGGRDGEPFFIEGFIEDVSAQHEQVRNRERLIHELQSVYHFIQRPIEPFIKPASLCAMSATVSAALKIMKNEDSSAILLTDAAGCPGGILTETDIRTRVADEQSNFSKQAMRFMSAPLITIQRSSTLSDAISLLNGENVRHLAVVDGSGNVCGILDGWDMQKALHSSYFSLLSTVSAAHSVSVLRSSYNQLVYLVKGHVDRRVFIPDIYTTTTAIADALYSRTVQLAIERSAPPPVPFAFLVLGSAGREEQTLATDQDTAIIFENVPAEQMAEVSDYFQKLSDRIATDLHHIGYQYCPGNVMSKNPKWCVSLQQWKEYFLNWITNANPQDLLELKIFFDFRTVYGNGRFADELYAHISGIASSCNSFFVYLSDGILRFQAPEQVLKLKSGFNIKALMLPIIDSMRLYALKNKIRETNTLKRLEALYESGGISQAMYRTIHQTYCFLSQKRLEHQSAMMDRNQTADNLISPAELSEIDTTLMKKSLGVIEELQNKVKSDIRGTVLG